MINTNRKNLNRRTGILCNSLFTAEHLEGRCLLSISAPVSYNTGTQADGFVPNAAPIGVASADVSGDGKLDLVVAHTADNSVYFLKGNGNGTFQPAVQIPVGQAIQGDVFVGDFNHDGKLDLFLPSANSQPIIMLGNGDGTFKPAITSSSFAFSGYYPRGWTVGDFNGDGNLDVACTLPSNSTNTGRYIVLLGNGDGTFKSGIVGPAVLGYSRWMATGDFNHDGKLDLVTADGQGTSGNTGNVEMTVLLGNGDGTFTLGGHYASPQFPDGTNTAATSNPEDVVVADVNNDGKLDVIESDYDNTINVFLGNGDGTFQTARSFAPGNYPRDVVPVDINHDGKIDLVVTNVGINTGGALLSANGDEPGSVAVLLGNGDGTFQSPITYSPSAYPGYTAVGDFNGDGYPDLAVTQVLDGHSVKVMLNQPTSTNLPPSYTQSPSASPAVVTNNVTTLSALATDDGGESNLTYTWATVGSIPGAVTYSTNGTNASKSTNVTFATPGTYLFQCAATDAQGLSIMDLVTVTVNAATTTLAAPVASGPGSPSTPGPVLTTNTPTFAWSAVSGVTGYQINLHNNTTNTTASYQVGASVTSYPLATGVLAAGDSYVWNVRGLNGTQSGPPSANLSFQTAAATSPTTTVTGVTPSSGPTTGGTVVTIIGTNFTGVSSVKFGTVSAASFTVNSTTSITATSPAQGAGTVDVTVTDSVGTTAASTADRFTFVAPVTLPAPVVIAPGSTAQPGPVVTTLTPTFTWHALTGIDGYQLNLYDQTLKKFVSYQITGASSTSFTIPSSAALSPGDSFVWNLRVISGTVTGPESAYLYFQTAAAASPPAIAGVTPNSGPTTGGTVVTIIGANFTGISRVYFGSVSATSFTMNSATSISATTPVEGAGTVDVRVSGAGGASSSVTADRFTFVAPVTQPAPPVTSPVTLPAPVETPAANAPAPTGITTTSAGTLTPSLSGTLPTVAITTQAINLHQAVTLTNTTGQTVSGLARGTLYLSTGTTIDSSSIPLGTSKTTVRVKSGKHVTLHLKLKKVPAGIPNGVYHLVMKITDPHGISASVASAGTITVTRPI